MTDGSLAQAAELGPRVRRGDVLYRVWRSRGSRRGDHLVIEELRVAHANDKHLRLDHPPRGKSSSVLEMEAVGVSIFLTPSDALHGHLRSEREHVDEIRRRLASAQASLDSAGKLVEHALADLPRNYAR